MKRDLLASLAEGNHDTDQAKNQPKALAKHGGSL